MPSSMPQMQPFLPHFVEYLIEDARKDLRETGQIPLIAYMLHENPPGSDPAVAMDVMGLSTETDAAKDSSARELFDRAHAIRADAIVTVLEIWSVAYDPRSPHRPSDHPDRVEMFAIDVQEPGVHHVGRAPIRVVNGVKTFDAVDWIESVPPERARGRFANLLPYNARYITHLYEKKR